MKPTPPLLMLAEGRRPRPRRAPRVPVRELQTHIAVADLLRRFARPDWRWWHTPNGEIRDKRTAAKLKAMGVTPGVPDICLVSPDGRFHGLELKGTGGTLSEPQQDWKLWSTRHGISFAVADDLTQAVAILRQWDVLRVTIGGAA